jgi:hypothetical protein
MPTVSLPLPQDATWVPDSCRLPSAEQPLRVAELDRLLGTAVLDRELVSPLELVVHLAPGPEVAARAADLAVRESACCSFFTFTLTVTSDQLTLAIAVPEGHADVLAGLASRYR